MSTEHQPAGATMVYWLAQAAKQLRQQADVKQVEIAALVGGDQSTIYRFEQGDRYPNRLDLIIAAYAQECGVPDPRGIWELGLNLWHAHGTMPTVQVFRGEAPALAVGDALEAARQAFERELTEDAPATRRSPARNGGKSRAKRTG